MRVLCINGNGWRSTTTQRRADKPGYMEECIVIDELVENGRGGYILHGYGNEPYYKGDFIPLSEEPKLEVKEEEVCV